MTSKCRWLRRKAAEIEREETGKGSLRTKIDMFCYCMAQKSRSEKERDEDEDSKAIWGCTPQELEKCKPNGIVELKKARNRVRHIEQKTKARNQEKQMDA